MKKLKMFEIITSDPYSSNVYKTTRLGSSVADIKARYSGNGDFVQVKDVTANFPISEMKVIEALQATHFSEPEMEAIRYLLQSGYENASND